MALAPARPAIKLKTGVKLPASMAEGPGIDIARANGIYTIGLDYAALTDNAGIPDPTIYTIALLNTDTGEYEEAALDQVRSTTAAAVRTPVGDADYTILTTDRVVALTAALTAPRTWSLPTGLVGGTTIENVDEVGGISSTNTLTFTATGAETINGASSFVLNVAYAGARFVYDGTSKWTVELVGTTSIAPGALAVSAAGLAKMADGYFTATAGARAKFADLFLTTAKLADGVLSADAAGLAKMADGYLAASAGGRAKMADGFLSADATGLAKVADGFLSADAGGRAKMAAAFFSADATGLGKFADGFLTADATGRAKMADAFTTVPKGGTGLSTLTAYALLAAGTTATGNLQQIGLGTAGHVLTSAGAGALPAMAATKLPRSYLAGLALSNNGTDATNDIDIAAGECRSSDDTANLVIASAHVKQLDVVFAEYSVIGTASGGRDTADNLTGAKWFYAYLIGGSGKNDQAFFSTSASPTLPSGFTYSRTIGSVYWTGSTVKAFTQTGDVFHWTAPALDVDVTNLGGSTTGYTLTTPTGRKCLAILNITVGDGTAATRVYVHSPDNGDDAASATANPLATTWVIVNTANSSHGAVQIMTGTTSNIRAVSSDTSTTLKIATLGFIDRRGRDD
jgi:hypothetical protein